VKPKDAVCREQAGCCDKEDKCDGATKTCDDVFDAGKVCMTFSNWNSTTKACGLVEVVCDGKGPNCPVSAAKV
jgi:hypothetical protein